jgi:hypothetical protein
LEPNLSKKKTSLGVDAAQERRIKYTDGVDFTTNSSLKLKGYIKNKKSRVIHKILYISIYHHTHDYHGHFLKLQEGRGQVGSMAMFVATGPQ